MRVYVHLLRNGPCELREVQHGLGFSSASLASYHLSRLVKWGYAIQLEDGKYSASPDYIPELLDGFTKVGVAVVPQNLFFSALFTILVAFFSFEVIEGASYSVYLVGTSLAMVGVLWYETVRLWRRLTTWR